MVMPDGARDPIEARAGEDPLADGDMLPIDAPIGNRRRGMEVQTVVVQLAHSNIVQQAHERRFLCAPLVHLERLRHLPAEPRDRERVGEQFRVGPLARFQQPPGEPAARIPKRRQIVSRCCRSAQPLERLVRRRTPLCRHH
jgi:hypothetical protein